MKMQIIWACPIVFPTAQPHRFQKPLRFFLAQKQRVGLRFQSFPATAFPWLEKDFQLRPHAEHRFRNTIFTHETRPF